MNFLNARRCSKLVVAMQCCVNAQCSFSQCSKDMSANNNIVNMKSWLAPAIACRVSSLRAWVLHHLNPSNHVHEDDKMFKGQLNGAEYWGRNHEHFIEEQGGCNSLPCIDTRETAIARGPTLGKQAFDTPITPIRPKSGQLSTRTDSELRLAGR